MTVEFRSTPPFSTDAYARKKAQLLSKCRWGKSVTAKVLKAFFKEHLRSLISEELEKTKRPLIAQLNRIVTKISDRFSSTDDWPEMSKLAHRIVGAALSLTPADYDRFTPLPGDVKTLIFSKRKHTPFEDSLISKDFKKWSEEDCIKYYKDKFRVIQGHTLTPKSIPVIANYYSRYFNLDFTLIPKSKFLKVIPFFPQVKCIKLLGDFYLRSLHRYCPNIEFIEINLSKKNLYSLDLTKLSKLHYIKLASKYFCSFNIKLPESIQEIRVKKSDSLTLVFPLNAKITHFKIGNIYNSVCYDLTLPCFASLKEFKYRNYLRLNFSPIQFPPSLKELESLFINVDTNVLDLTPLDFPKLSRLFLSQIVSGLPKAPLLETLEIDMANIIGELNLTSYPFLKMVRLSLLSINTLYLSSTLEKVHIDVCESLREIHFYGQANTIKSLELYEVSITQLDLREFTQLETLIISTSVDCEVLLNELPINFDSCPNVEVTYGPTKRLRIDPLL